MSDADQRRWDKRYLEGAYAERLDPNPFLQQWLPAPTHSTAQALDIACGAGRNTLHLARAGYQAHGWDISEVGLAQAAAKALDESLTIDFKHVDLDTATIAPEHYDVIIVIRFLDRALLLPIQQGLKRGGTLIYEQHLQTEDTDVGGPRRAQFRFAPGELAGSFSALESVHYAEDVIDDPDGKPMAVAQLVARKP